MGKHLLTYLLFLWVGVMSGLAFVVQASPNFYFKQLSQQDGLPQNFVRSIMLDHNGFFWIGTSRGVSRFDRHEFKNYSAVPDLSLIHI